MKNITPGWFPIALTPLALALLVLGSAVIHAAQPVADNAGLTSVFNGQNLKGWTLQAHAVWQVENGELVGRQDPAEKEDSWLFSDAEWSDFALELEFKVPEKCNSGIALRMPGEATGSPDVHGYEVQISDLPARKLTGSLLHHIESKTNNLHRANEWNRLAVTCEGDHIVVYLNGLKVMDAKEKGSKKGRIGMQVPKGAEFSRQEVRFRNIRVKELKPKRAPAEMLVNGNFADGTNHWVVMESGATGRAEIVAEGPEGKTALRLKVLTVGDKPWRLQIYQTGMRVEKGKSYVLTFWAKSDRAGSIMVNCMQNHAPWDHQTQKQIPVSSDWEPLRFTFVAPWDDDKVRISFTDLGTVPDQIYWFASCSLVPNPETKTTPR